jgi:hypothetical protein
MIRFVERYSRTDEPDGHGRWARIVMYKDLRIAWISKITGISTDKYMCILSFPTSSGDLENFVLESYKEAQDIVKDRWATFLIKVLKP